MQDAEEFCIEDEVDEEQKKTRPVIKNAMDLQRLKLEKLMKNPDKPIIIPEQAKEKDFMQTVPTFVRNVMGSSAGAGSGEFHVYRHLRRKEYARQKFIQAKSIREQLDDEYRQKLEQNRMNAEAKTAKRRAKRLKKKQKMKQKGKKPRKECEETQNNDESLSESSEAEDKSDTDANSQSIEIPKQSEEKEPTITNADDNKVNNEKVEEQAKNTKLSPLRDEFSHSFNDKIKSVEGDDKVQSPTQSDSSRKDENPADQESEKNVFQQADEKAQADEKNIDSNT